MRPRSGIGHLYRIRPDPGLNFGPVVSDGKNLHHDTLCRLSVALPDKATLISTWQRAVAFGAHVGKPPRSAWAGRPLLKLWLTYPDCALTEVHARLTPEELARKAAGTVADARP